MAVSGRDSFPQVITGNNEIIAYVPAGDSRAPVIISCGKKRHEALTLP